MQAVYSCLIQVAKTTMPRVDVASLVSHPSLHQELKLDHQLKIKWEIHEYSELVT